MLGLAIGYLISVYGQDRNDSLTSAGIYSLLTMVAVLTFAFFGGYTTGIGAKLNSAIAGFVVGLPTVSASLLYVIYVHGMNSLVHTGFLVWIPICSAVGGLMGAASRCNRTSSPAT